MPFYIYHNILLMILFILANCIIITGITWPPKPKARSVIGRWPLLGLDNMDTHKELLRVYDSLYSYCIYSLSSLLSNITKNLTNWTYLPENAGAHVSRISADNS